MIIKINYNKSTGALTLTDDEELMEATAIEVVDNTDELSFEISELAMDVSQYQEFYKLEDGNDN